MVIIALTLVGKGQIYIIESCNLTQNTLIPGKLSASQTVFFVSSCIHIGAATVLWNYQESK